ncbi:LamG-like jellyroll fold domain-containing protein [Leptospira andrefontaineae]|uniref:LamG domain-containing protein n=1 Tax=Leptospira andrefontaineae TaxID=2484976 RepID=A0A4R9GY87_9LEPT|nr:LamG-like jellyroll fold domain-containing protein [Leptospira andrefontaineae]TGK36658.1 LamG domain-containing protein [Leptospira andrefontaineae]
MPNIRSYPFLLLLLVTLSSQNCGTYLLANILLPSNENNGLESLAESIVGAMNVGLIHYWPLDGDANDRVGTLHLTAFGTVGPVLTFDHNNLPNGAYFYDGIDSWHDSGLGGEPILSGISSFTLSAWVKGKFKPSPGIIMGAGDGLGFQLADNSSCLQIRAYSTNGGTGVVSNLSPCRGYQDDVWYNVTLTWDLPNSRANLYIGNDLVDSRVYNPNRVPWTSGFPITLGYGTLGGGSQVVTIDEVRVYDRIVPPILFGF